MTRLQSLSFGKLCEEYGYAYECGQWSKATAHQGWENNTVQYGKLGAHCCPRIVDRFLKLERQVQQYNEVTTATLRKRKMEAIQQKPETKKQGQQSSIELSSARPLRLVGGVHRKSRRCRSASMKGHTRKHY